MGAVLTSTIPAPYTRNPDRFEVGEEHFMSAQISVLGVNRPEGGLKESQAAFRKHHVEVGDALLNVSGIGTATGEVADKDDPRPAYVHQPFPCMLYHADGRDTVVRTQTELAAAKGIGFRHAPYPKPGVHVGTLAEEKKFLLDQLADERGKLAMQNELLLEMKARLDALEGANASTAEAVAKPAVKR